MWSTTIYVLVAAILVLNVRGLPLAFHVRLMYSLWRGLRQGRLASLDDVDVWSTRVMVDDMDLNIHMNNRYKYMARLLGSMSKLRGISVANGGVGFQFIKEVRLLDYLTFHTSLVAHDRKWFMMRHVVKRGNTVVAVGVAKMVFKRKSGKTIPPAEMFAELGYDTPITKAGPSTQPAASFSAPTHIPLADRVDTLRSAAIDSWLGLENALQSKL